MQVLSSALLALFLVAPFSAGRDPFAFFQPTVSLGAADLAILTRGAPLVRVLPATGHDVAAFTAIGVGSTVTVERAAAWMRRVELLRENRYVIASQRLSSPPRLSDFDRLVLDDEDLEDIRRCVPGRCGVKLSAPDIGTLTKVAATGGSNWKPLLQHAFREMLLRRAVTFAAGGRAALDDIVDKRRPSSPASAFASLVEQTTFLNERMPDLAARLVRCANAPHAGSESFMYWSNERLGGRPVITITHVTLMAGYDGSRPLMMVGAQVYASHYLDASLTVTAYLQDGPGSPGYFVYLHRSSVDLLGGFWGGFARSIIEGRVRKDGPAIIRHVGQRLAGGDPPITSDRHGWPR
jgi:hypothetical protein